VVAPARPEHVARDLIEAALRAAAAYNVSTIVTRGPGLAADLDPVVRTPARSRGGKKRQRSCRSRAMRLTRNPIVRGLPAPRSLELVALSLCQAIPTTSKSTGVNVWTFRAEPRRRLVARGADWPIVRGIVYIWRPRALRRRRHPRPPSPGSATSSLAV